MIDDDPVQARDQVAEGVAIGRNSCDRFAYGLCLTPGSPRRPVSEASVPVALVRDTLQSLDQAIDRVGSPTGAGRRDAASGLSPREREVVALVASGLTNRQIADRLFISERTVDTHITRIRRKLGTTTRTQLAVWAFENRQR